MDKEIQLHLDDGREYYSNKEYKKAESCLLKVVANECRFADVMNMLGVIYNTKGQFDLAQKYFKKALGLNANYTEAALNLAVTYNEQGKYSEARQIHDNAIFSNSNQAREIEPFARGKLTNMHANLGQAYAELQLLEKAIDQFNQALELNPDFVDIRTKLGQILKDAGKLNEAEKHFLMVKKTKPSYVPAILSLGATYFAKGDKQAAHKEWKAALNINSENKTAKMYIKMIEQMIEQDEAADAGVDLNTETPKYKKQTDKTKDANENNIDTELDFSFDGQHSSVVTASDSDNIKDPSK